MKFKVFQDLCQSDTEYHFYFSETIKNPFGWYDLIDDPDTMVEPCQEMVFIGEYTTP